MALQTRVKQEGVVGIKLARKDIQLEQGQALYKTNWGWEIWEEPNQRRVKRIPRVAVLALYTTEQAR